MTSLIEITINAICVGIGVAIGTPIGQWLLDKIRDHNSRLKKAIKLADINLANNTNNAKTITI